MTDGIFSGKLKKLTCNVTDAVPVLSTVYVFLIQPITKLCTLCSTVPIIQGQNNITILGR